MVLVSPLLIRLSASLCGVLPLAGAESFRVATYNLQNYLDAPAGSRPAKSEASRAKIRECIRESQADVLALQEIGGTNALLELRASLKAEGLDYPHWEHVSAWDTNIHLAVLSKFPIVARRPHTNDSFVLLAKQYHVRRGFAEVDIRVATNYSFTLITAHLKSRLPVYEANEAELRTEEAKILREKIDTCFATNVNVNLVVLGDFNDTPDTRSTRAVIGRKHALIDTRPAERNGDDQPNENPRYPPPKITWTHYYGKEDRYSRIDYILLSRGLAHEWRTNETFIPTVPNWGVGSDHRPIVATFWAQDR